MVCAAAALSNLTGSPPTSARAAATWSAFLGTHISRLAPRASSTSSGPRPARPTWNSPLRSQMAFRNRTQGEVTNDGCRHRRARRCEREPGPEGPSRQLGRREAGQWPLLLHTDRLPGRAADLDPRVGL